MIKVMILGDTGLIGKHLVNELKHDHDVIGLSRCIDLFDYKHVTFDLETEEIKPLLMHYKPDIFISCTRGNYAKQLNCHQDIVDYGKLNQMMLYYYSTANVFDADPTEIKVESSRLNPKSEYGVFKANCEKLVSTYDESRIIRLPMVMAKDSPRMAEIRNAKEKKIKIYDTLHLSLILANQVAILQREVIEKSLTGIFHFATYDTIKQKDFYETLVTNKELLIIEKLDNYYLAVVPTRTDITNRFCIEDVIKGLI